MVSVKYFRIKTWKEPEINQAVTLPVDWSFGQATSTAAAQGHRAQNRRSTVWPLDQPVPAVKQGRLHSSPEPQFLHLQNGGYSTFLTD